MSSCDKWTGDGKEEANHAKDVVDAAAGVSDTAAAFAKGFLTGDTGTDAIQLKMQCDMAKRFSCIVDIMLCGDNDIPAEGGLASLAKAAACYAVFSMVSNSKAIEEACGIKVEPTPELIAGVMEEIIRSRGSGKGGEE